MVVNIDARTTPDAWLAITAARLRCRTRRTGLCDAVHRRLGFVRIARGHHTSAYATLWFAPSIYHSPAPFYRRAAYSTGSKTRDGLVTMARNARHATCCGNLPGAVQPSNAAIPVCGKRWVAATGDGAGRAAYGRHRPCHRHHLTTGLCAPVHYSTRPAVSRLPRIYLQALPSRPSGICLPLTIFLACWTYFRPAHHLPYSCGQHFYAAGARAGHARAHAFCYTAGTCASHTRTARCRATAATFLLLPTSFVVLSFWVLSGAGGSCHPPPCLPYHLALPPTPPHCVLGSHPLHPVYSADC